MSENNDIEISGSFTVQDGNGREQIVKSIRIYDETYGVIDVFVDFTVALEKGSFRDHKLISGILNRLRSLGYVGPDFGATDPTIQERKMIVLEATEEFCQFAKTKGWKNLAEEYE
ncbi:hypothetical protein KDM90_03805 [Undibacterium sp. FT137W]|uniref:Uncharacterized protein n=2 Tax=Undibacterium fentianense TaxID=2828728 RepID=A0A941DYJ3_9BURK|nr:hypothetical protein [Undibacterium fentianense]